MPRSNFIAVASALCLGALVGACEPESVPFVPTFEADIKPIMISRCVRCHGGGGTLNTDPKHGGVLPGQPPIDGFFDRLEDDCADGATLMCHGLLHYTVPPALTIFRGYIHAKADAQRMPPPPTPPLTDHQLLIIDRWLAENPPM